MAAAAVVFDSVEINLPGGVPGVFRIGPERHGNIYKKMPGDAIAWLNEIGSDYSNPGEKLMLALAARNADEEEDIECVYVCRCVRKFVCIQRM